MCQAPLQALYIYCGHFKNVPPICLTLLLLRGDIYVPSTLIWAALSDSVIANRRQRKWWFAISRARFERPRSVCLVLLGHSSWGRQPPCNKPRSPDSTRLEVGSSVTSSSRAANPRQAPGAACERAVLATQCCPAELSDDGSPSRHLTTLA